MRNRTFINCMAVMLLCLPVISSCRRSETPEYKAPEFKTERTAEFNVLGEERETLNLILDIAVHGPYILLVAPEKKDGKWVHVYDKATGDDILHCVNSGRGPKECLFSRDTHFDPVTGVMRIYDEVKGSKFEFQVDSLVEFGISALREEKYEAPAWNSHIIELNGGNRLYIDNPSHLAKDTSSVPRIEVVSASGELVSSYDGFPYYDDDAKRWMAYSHDRADISPDKSRAVILTTLGGIMEVFDLSDGVVSLRSLKYMYPPEFTVEGEGFLSPSDTDKALDSFIDVSLTNDRIYAGMGGSVATKQNLKKPVEERELTFRNIAIFDFDGEGVEKIKTDYLISRLCVDNDGTVYAAIKDLYGRAYLGRLKL